MLYADLPVYARRVEPAYINLLVHVTKDKCLLYAWFSIPLPFHTELVPYNQAFVVTECVTVFTIYM